MIYTAFMFRWLAQHLPHPLSLVGLLFTGKTWSIRAVLTGFLTMFSVTVLNTLVRTSLFVIEKSNVKQ